MANHKSAAKRARQSVKRNSRNRSYLSKVRTAIKSFQSGLDELREKQKSPEELQKLFVTAQSLLGKAATKGIVHRNNASRRISRLAARMAKAVKASPSS